MNGGLGSWTGFHTPLMICSMLHRGSVVVLVPPPYDGEDDNSCGFSSNRMFDGSLMVASSGDTMLPPMAARKPREVKLAKRAITITHKRN